MKQLAKGEDMTQKETRGPRIVKRYSNRKLYDVATSQYITLTTLISFISNGEDVRVVEHATQTDVTGQTLLNALVETEPNVESQVDTLREILRAGGLGNYVNELNNAAKLARLATI